MDMFSNGANKWAQLMPMKGHTDLVFPVSPVKTRENKCWLGVLVAEMRVRAGVCVYAPVFIHSPLNNTNSG